MADSIKIEIDNDSSDSADDAAISQALKESVMEIESQEEEYTSEQLEQISYYKKLISLNRETDAGYRELISSFYRMLIEVRKRLKENEEAIIRQSKIFHEAQFSYLRVGKPYFKDRNKLPAPENEDTIIMRKAQMYDFSLVSSVPGWTVKDKAQLVNALLEMSRDIKRTELRSQIIMLQKDKKNVIEVGKLEREVQMLHKKSLAELALPLDQEYDWEYLANSLNRRHTAKEYQALWRLFFHPSINKSSWTKSEHEKLQKIALAHKNQDWDAIAKELKTGRSAYQCFVYYRTNKVDNSINRKWTHEEMKYLKRLVEYFREGTYIPWGKVASAMENRTKIQIYNKYTRMVQARKGRFMEEEDIVLLHCYDRYGEDFKRISKYLPIRTIVQLKSRLRILTKFRLSSTWTEKEDRKLLQLMGNMDSNTSFSSATKHFPGKDRVIIRSRYLTLLKWMQSHPASDVALAPRRGPRRLLHGNMTVSLNHAVANLKKKMQAEVKTKLKKTVTIHSCEEKIEDEIMAALVNEIIQEESCRKLNQSELGEAHRPASPQDMQPENMDNLSKLLILFNASLDKDAFNNSKYATEYRELIKTSPRESLKIIKSYSKAEKVQTIKVEDFPDVWGEKAMLKRSSYVLPPNYGTITGCRVLLGQLGEKAQVKGVDEINLSLMQRKNAALKQAINTLKEQYITLFMWPVMLSQQMPVLNNKPYVFRPLADKKCIPVSMGFTMPKLSQRLFNFRAKRGDKFRNTDANDIDEPKPCKSDLNKIQYSSAVFKDEMNSSDED